MANFWNEMSLEPYRGFRWLLEMKSIGQRIYAMKVDKPAFKVGEYSHKILNHQFNYPGRVVWDPIAATVVDVPNGPATTLFSSIQKGGYAYPTVGAAAEGTDGLTKTAFGNAVGNTGTIEIVQLKANQAAGGNLATHMNGQRWKLNNCFLTDIKFGSLDYSSEDAVQIQFTIRYDWAEYLGEGAQ